MNLFNQEEQGSVKRLDKRILSKIEDGDIEVKLSSVIKENLKYLPRPYQEEAFSVLDYYLNNQKLRAKPTQVLFHMATGSGKTLVMAGAMLELYKMGYRNFIFFVNTDTIIRKTKQNFLEVNSSKYLFKNQINIDGQEVKINEVSNFESVNADDINILFSTIQGLHTRLNNPRENGISFDDFMDKKLVLISDEAHHINSLTKKKLSKNEQENFTSWEYTIMRLLRSNVENIMLEFTATLDLSDVNIASKYADKLLYNYPLSKFREDGFSKEVETNQVDYKPLQRAIVAVLISQFKKKIFATNGIIAKPVILFQSKTTKESAEMEKAFLEEIQNLSLQKLNDLIKLDNKILNKAIAYFKELGISLENLIDEIKDDFSEEKIISVNSKNDSNEKQIVINSLEDENNEYRAVFSVYKLNEGWDVLNLYDIVRLYDTRDSSGKNPGKTTVAEAQLIGRGARYYPFTLEEDQEKYKRKYDKDIDNIMRFCETLHYHCSHNPRYITELNNALRQIGMFPDEKVERDLFLKKDFMETNLYKNGFVFVNKKVKNNPKTLLEYQEPTITKSHSFALRTNRSDTTIILDNKRKQNKVQANYANKHYLHNWDKTIIKKAFSRLPFYYFSNIKRYFPSVNSVDEFITNPKYFGGICVEVTGLQGQTKDLTREQQLEIAIDIATKIANGIMANFGEYRGTRNFYREPFRKYFKKHKKLSFSVNLNQTAETGKPTIRPDIDPKYFVDLNQSDWYAYNENYGTSEEKFLVKYFHNHLEELKEKFKNIYLVRNERFLKIYRFSDGKATEPDFVLFMNDKFSDREVVYQLFIEPKGDHLLLQDAWKNEFLQELETEAKIELFQNQEYRLIGMPLYNKEKTEGVFDEKLNEI